MERKAIMTLLAVFAPLLTTGCGNIGHQAQVQQHFTQELLYSPSWTGLPTCNITRSAWPSTTAYRQVDEQIDYRERIIDRQGWFGDQRDFYYRRFDSTRTGRGRR